MTMTVNNSAGPPAPAVEPGTISKDVQQRVQAAISEMRADLFERDTLIHSMWVAVIGQLHLLQLGPGGIAKTYSIRRLVQHIENARYFEATLDETTDPSMVYGPPNVKAMVEEGKTSFCTEGMLPEAHYTMLDEFFNANQPLLHSLQPLLNERVHPNGGVTSQIPLRSCFMGTNKLNADVEVAWLWDRVHIRELVDDIQDRQNSMAMLGAAISRMALVGRGTSTTLPGQSLTKLTLTELDQAHVEALSLPIPDAVLETFYDMRDELRNGAAQVRISPRREVESMAAVLANAWVRGHDEVQVTDLDILASMWWTVQDQRAEARSVILAAANPSEKAALELLDELAKVKIELAAMDDSSLDASRKTRIAIEQISNLDRLLEDAGDHLNKAKAGGVGTTRIEEVIGKANAVKVKIGKDHFGMDYTTQQNLVNAAR